VGVIWNRIHAQRRENGVLPTLCEQQSRSGFFRGREWLEQKNDMNVRMKSIWADRDFKRTN
jgi:hypothetical protein